MIFDDIFSALDPATMGTIMTKLFAQNGLFRRLKTSVIIVSNSSTSSSHQNNLGNRRMLMSIQPLLPN